MKAPIAFEVFHVNVLEDTFCFRHFDQNDEIFRLDKLKQRVAGGIKGDTSTKTTREKPPPLLASFSTYFPLSAFFSKVAILTKNYILAKELYFNSLVEKVRVIKILRVFIEPNTDNTDVKNVHSTWQRPTVVNEKFKIQNSMNNIENPYGKLFPVYHTINPDVILDKDSHA